jgi:hypothetical protein
MTVRDLLAALGIVCAVVLFGLFLFQGSNAGRLDFDATLFTGAAIALALLIISRPFWFWNDPRVAFVRRRLGEPATVVVYLAFAIAIGVVSVRRQLAFTHARQECQRLLAAAATPQQRMAVLYRNGVTGLPDVNHASTAFSCERLLRGP